MQSSQIVSFCSSLLLCQRSSSPIHAMLLISMWCVSSVWLWCAIFMMIKVSFDRGHKRTTHKWLLCFQTKTRRRRKRWKKIIIRWYWRWHDYWYWWPRSHHKMSFYSLGRDGCCRSFTKINSVNWFFQCCGNHILIRPHRDCVRTILSDHKSMWCNCSSRHR